MKRNLVIAIISLLLTACGGNVVYTQFKSLPVKGWEADSLVRRWLNRKRTSSTI